MILASPLISRIARYYHIYLNHAFKPLGINASQYLYIIILCNEKFIRQDKLPDRIGINKSNVARNLAWLEKNGFIYRSGDDKDRRTYKIFPTNKSYKLYNPIMNIIEEWNKIVLGMDDLDLKSLNSQLTKIIIKAEELAKQYIDE